MPQRAVISIIGAGLAGSEAAYQAAKFGLAVKLYEMRPHATTPAHETPHPAELVCSNSLKSTSLENASGILKEEMLRLDSLVIRAALAHRVPAGKALAVNRVNFSLHIDSALTQNPLIEMVREEATGLMEAVHDPVIVATGPLTSPVLAEKISALTGRSRLYFYDSISPIIDADTVDHARVFRASRYESVSTEGEGGGGDYLNCPLTKDEYYLFVSELIKGEKVLAKDFEKSLYFEGCLPIEVMAERGPDTLMYGPMKPVGLVDPKTGRKPFAVVQLRTENAEGTMYNLVGFQTKLKYPEQKRIFRMIPGLEKAEFMRYGSIHRNTYIHSPELLRPTLELKQRDNLLFSGQITGVEGYVESAAMGIVAGRNAALKALGEEPVTYPPETSIGALLSYITNPGPGTKGDFQPMNINFGLYPPLPGEMRKKIRKKERKRLIAERALKAIEEFDRAAFARHLNTASNSGAHPLSPHNTPDDQIGSPPAP